MVLYCPVCCKTRSFVDNVALYQHARSKGHPCCRICEEVFKSTDDLNEHYEYTPDHPYCSSCKRRFVDEAAFTQHAISKPEKCTLEKEEMGRPFCNICNKAFSSKDTVITHYSKLNDHPYCNPCQMKFINYTALEQHVRDVNHNFGKKGKCKKCNVKFPDVPTLQRHFALSGLHNYCPICSKDFPSATALAQHNKSPVHKDRNHFCPMCTRGHKVPSSTAQHLESGTCHHITRHQVKAAVHSLNIEPAIAVSQRLLTGNTSSTVVQYTATEDAFDGTGYVCLLCKAGSSGNGRRFATLSALNAHLHSPAHDDNEFKCPHCEHEFTVLSALMHHIESEACGAAKLKKVEDIAHSLVDQFSRMLKM